MTRKNAQIKLVLPVAILGLSALLYQNCGQSGFVSDSGSGGLSISKSDGTLDSTPFAFETQLDTISYNSCFGGTLANNPGFHTLRVSGNDGGGVRLRKEFLDYAFTKLRPSYPSTVVTMDQVKKLASDSSVNKDAQPQFSVRQIGTFANYTRDGGTPSINTDYFNALGSLTDDRWMTTIVEKSVTGYRGPAGTKVPFTGYFPIGSTSGKNLVSTLTWNGQGTSQWQDAEAFAKYVREAYFNTDAVLAITYPAEGSALWPRGLVKDTGTTAYGTGYRLQFSAEASARSILSGNLSMYNPRPTNILSDIEEIDLSTGQLGTGSWSCDPLRRYTVVRAADRATYCPVEDLFSVASNPTSAFELALVRRHFSADKWDVNISARCVVPKDADCYPADGATPGTAAPIAYNQSEACFQSTVPSYPGYAPGSGPAKLCAQHVSVCIRN